MAGKKARASNAPQLAIGTDINRRTARLMLAKVIGSPVDKRLPIRNRVQVLPDLGYETRNRSSGKVVSLRPALTLPSNTCIE